MIRSKMLSVLVILVLAIPLYALPGSASVGTVQSSIAAAVRGVPLAPGTSVFPGDTVTVGASGQALITFAGGAQLFLGQNSNIEILPADEGGAVMFSIAHGAARFRSTAKLPMQALLGDATFGAAAGTAGVGYIVISSPNAARVGSEKGTMVLTTSHDGKSVALAEGTAMDVKLVPDTNDDETRGGGKRNRKGGLIVLTGVVIIVGTGVAAAIIAVHEPKAPGVISPFSPQ
ncbi:MAG: hypothetical protein ACRD50_03570 [Candidatus Acidiferrales bacterium]